MVHLAEPDLELLEETFFVQVRGDVSWTDANNISAAAMQDHFITWIEAHRSVKKECACTSESHATTNSLNQQFTRQKTF